MTTRFAWDPAKAASSLRKHGVSFEEALTVFGDPLARIHDDPHHSARESREIIVGDTSIRIMKKRRGPRNRQPQGDLAPEYRFDYSKSRPNRFARQIAKNAVVVLLDPDVAAVFRDPKRVNSLLRATIAALKKPGAPRRRPQVNRGTLRDDSRYTTHTLWVSPYD